MKSPGKSRTHRSSSCLLAKGAMSAPKISGGGFVPSYRAANLGANKPRTEEAMAFSVHSLNLESVHGEGRPKLNSEREN